MLQFKTGDRVRIKLADRHDPWFIPLVDKVFIVAYTIVDDGEKFPYGIQGLKHRFAEDELDLVARILEQSSYWQHPTLTPKTPFNHDAMFKV